MPQAAHTVVHSFSIPPAVLAALREQSAREDLSMSQIVRRALVAYGVTPPVSRTT